MQKVNIFWFRRDLRLEDNHALFHALSDTLPVLLLFIFDKNILEKLEDNSDARVEFIHRSITKIDDELRKFGGNIHVVHSTPVDVFTSLSKQYDIQNVYANADYEPYALSRDSQVRSILSEQNAQLRTFKDHVVFEKGEILNGQNEPYKVFTPYKNQWLKKLESSDFQHYPSENFLEHKYILRENARLELADLGFQKLSINFPSISFDEKLIDRYAEQRDFPSVLGTSKMGIHFRFGTVSMRKAVSIARAHSETWLNELIWREFYIMILANFPQVVDRAFKPQYDHIPWINDEKQFELWCDGRTGYPIVDAGMRELNATGFMHNRVRMIVASFLTKHLLIDWRWGEAYFAKKLLDFELASNNGGWQWAAGTGTDAQPYFRVFNPESQQLKFDAHFEYIKKWIPEYQTSAYPSPIVDHKFARERAINVYKQALS
jgi:deoxyribodipyrimidine photo-lyase